MYECGIFNIMGGHWFSMPVLVFVLLFLWIVFNFKDKRNMKYDVMDKLNNLYATGEITEEEYLQRKRILKRR
ncbi:MAG: SHOCT domain-containing protein [Fusobacterium sp.]